MKSFDLSTIQYIHTAKQMTWVVQYLPIILAVKVMEKLENYNEKKNFYTF